MQKITIKNLGPIKEIVDLEVKDFMVFIGPQASGKSTIAKAIHFFKSFKDDLFKLLTEKIESGNFESPAMDFVKILRVKILRYFGNISPELYLSFDYGNGNSIILTLNFSPNENFFNAYLALHDECALFSDKYLVDPSKLKLLTTDELIRRDEEKRTFWKRIQTEIEENIVGESRRPDFIPAGRSFLSTFTDQIYSIDENQLDELNKIFISQIRIIRTKFYKPLIALTNDTKNISNPDLKINYPELGIKFINKIIKGDYIFDSGIEKIFISDGKYIRLNFASSGQQEALWVLNFLFLIFLENRKTSVTIEEPEAHLYPETQKDIVNFISLLGNFNQSQVFITTHSPYILAAVNNLLLAFKAGQFNRKDVNEKVPSETWLNPENVSAYKVANGTIENIIDPELGLIQNEKIDSASAFINEEFDYLAQYI